MGHPNSQIIRELYDARDRGDLETVRTLLASDIVWQEPGLHNPHTGDLKGPDAVLGMKLLE